MARVKTDYIVIHCSQTRPSQDIGVAEIDRWHRQRGWLGCGYARVIRRNGVEERGRDDDALQAHVKDYNHLSTSVCMVGGSKEEDWTEPENNFTPEQWATLRKTLIELKEKYPDAKIVGHYALSDYKSCPNFDVDEYLVQEGFANQEEQVSE